MIRVLKILVIILVSSLAVHSQIYIKPNNSYGAVYNRVRKDSSDLIPTFCGTPSGTASLHSTNQHMSALYYDSCGRRFYVFNPSDSSWTKLGATQLTDSSFKVGRDTIIIRGTGGGGGGAPSGPAGGDLTGTYPNPTIASNAVTSSKFRQSAGLSVVGKSTTGTGNVADITASTANTVLNYDGTSLNYSKVGLTNTVTGILPIANGGTNTASPALIAGTNITITGPWPNQTINSTGSGIDTTILTLTPGGSISWDFNNGTFAQVSLSVNGTLSTPTNLFKGATGVLKVIHTVAGTTLALPGLSETDLNYRSIKSSVTFTTDSSTVQGIDRYLKYIRVKPAHPLTALKIGTTNAGTDIQPAIAVDSAKWTTINVGEYYDQDSVLYFSGITSSTQVVYVTETNTSNTNFPWSYNAGDVDYAAFTYDGSTLYWSKSNYGTNLPVATGTAYEAESVAFFAVNTGLSTTVKDAVNNLVIAAKGIGWSKFAAIWPAVGGTSTKNGYNLVNTSRFNITFSGGWTHSSTGSLADGTTGYADVLPNMAQMEIDGYIGAYDLHFAYYNRTSFSPSTDCILYDNGAAGAMEWDNYGSHHYVAPISTSALDVARTGITGLCLISRRANNDAEAYRDGTSLGTKTNTQTISLSSGGMRLNRSYASAAFYSPTEFAGGSCGRGLTSSEVTTWTNAWNTFQTAIGR